MAKFREFLNNEIVHFLLLAFVIGILTFLIPQSIGLGAGGFDSAAVLQQFGFYQVGGLFMLFLVIAFFIEMIIRKGDNKYGNSIAFSSQGKSPAVNFFSRFSSFQLALLSLILFSAMFLLVTTVRQTSFIGFQTLEQQFTPTAELLFSALLVSGSENLGMALVIAACLIGLRIWARRVDMNEISFKIYYYLIAVVGAGYWVVNHLLRYAGQDYQLGVVFMFGFAMALITLLTGSFIPAWIMHGSNNLFFDMQKMFSRDNIVWLVIGAIVFLIFLYIFIYRKGNKNKVEVK